GLVGIYCLVVGRMGWLEERVLGTTAVVGTASILGLASAIPWERRRWHPIGPVGLAAVAVALVLVLVAIWVDLPWPRPAREAFYKTMGVACVVGIALPHVGLLSLARLRREYGWVRRCTAYVIAALAAMIAFTIITEIDGRDDEWFRAMGVVGITVVCGTIAVPVLHRVSAIRVREAIRTVELLLSITCPRCNKTQDLPVGRSKCAQCGLKFLIEIDEEHCQTCGYPLYRLESTACPECGTPIRQDTAQ
ncbi:MAG: hypothetical protein JSU86_05215, partial [Phycisphaerales bacterium]